MTPNTIINGDCLAVMRDFPAESVGLVVTSPPYNLKQSTGGGLRGGGNWAKWNRKIGGGYDGHGDKMPVAQYDEWQREVLRECWRVLKPDGAIFYNHKWRVQAGVMQDRAAIVGEFPVRQIIIWQRAGGMNFNDCYFLPTYEVIYLIAKKDFRLRRGANGAGDIWRFPQDRGNPHPAPFPVQIPAQIIKSTHDNGVVLDCFMGSGTTAVAAHAAGREWLGIEQSEKYCEMARARLAATSPPLL